MAEEQTMRTTKVKKEISRTIWTAKYEGLTIGVSFEEEITWADIVERQTKLDNITKHLTNELVRTLNDACTELGLEDKKIFKSKDPQKDDTGGCSIKDNIFDTL